MATMHGQELVEALASTVDGVTDVCGDLTAAEWALPTGCPGWTVQDTVAHLVGLETAIITGVEPDHELVGEFPHATGPVGEYMERHVDARRHLPADAVLTEFVAVFLGRLAALRALPDSAFDEPARGPMGSMNPLGRMLGIRVFDVWAHEQDIRRAVGRPGGYDTPAAAVSFDRCTAFAGPAKAAVMPDGSTLVWELEGPYAGVHAWSFADGKGTRLDDVPAEPTVRLTADSETFMVLCCGRSDARPQDVRVEGDAALAQAILDDPGFTP
ncbi:MAG: hypothetical protein QOK28_2629 [Actinomycetota bacterium]